MPDVRLKSMAQKRARHFGESKTVCGMGMLIFGVCIGICMAIIWPQDFLITIFNSRLAYRLILNVDDYYTCNEKYQEFIIDEPSAEYAMVSLYLYSVSNMPAVIQQGFKPQVKETGPFGYIKNTYRYDVVFDSEDPTTVTFKEYSYLQAVDDPTLCQKMYFRMDSDLDENNPCSGTSCLCQDPNLELTIVNPLFLKVLWQDTPFALLAAFSTDVFSSIKVLLDAPFTEAVQASIVSRAFKEIYQFRVQAQLGPILKTAYKYLRGNYTAAQIADDYISVPTCGLSKYGISTCPFNPFGSYLPYQIENTSVSQPRPLFSHYFALINELVVLC